MFVVYEFSGRGLCRSGCRLAPRDAVGPRGRRAPSVLLANIRIKTFAARGAPTLFYIIKTCRRMAPAPSGGRGGAARGKPIGLIGLIEPIGMIRLIGLIIPITPILTLFVFGRKISYLCRWQRGRPSRSAPCFMGFLGILREKKPVFQVKMQVVLFRKALLAFLTRLLAFKKTLPACQNPLLAFRRARRRKVAES